MTSYDAQTLQSSNPLARYAHRNRLNRSLTLALPRLAGGMLLDYGCGAGAFLAQVLDRHPGRAVGYEPYMTERAESGLPIYGSLELIECAAPFSLVTRSEERRVGKEC